LAFSVTPEISSLLAKIRAAAPYFPEGFVFSNKDGSRYTGHDISCAVSRRGLEAGIPNVSIHRIRRTVSSILRTYLPARTVAALLGHREETGTASYSYDVAEIELQDGQTGTPEANHRKSNNSITLAK
jgi:integrase